MANTQLTPLVGAVKKADGIKTAFALSVLRLTQAPYVPSVNSTITELEAAEADYDGYAAVTLTAWTGPQLADGGGAVITSPVAVFTYGPAGAPPVTNEVTGWWIEDAAGVPRLVGTFGPTKILGEVPQGFSMVVQDVEGRNSVVVVE